ncbi:MAG: hypothetical protein JSW61_02800 [Candidatus Thorarchaeota archaeon]|nr:MAG: hypothetical protein JSW61_02800 [Candidatus Thorarchaeota archaeon]
MRPYELAKELKVSRPFISKAQRIAEQRIEKLLRHAASINRIRIRDISTKYGLVYGYCPAYDTETYIFYSPKIGIQTWYAHRGECGSCELLKQCETTLKQIAEEWEIEVPEATPPTDLSIYLFDIIMRRMKWVKGK